MAVLFYNLDRQCPATRDDNPGGLRSLRLLRTLPLSPSSSPIGDNLYPAGPIPLPVAEGGHASGIVIPMAPYWAE